MSRSFVLLVGAAVVAGLTAEAARADDAHATPAPAWCVARSAAQPVCVYDDLLACSMNAFVTGGYCVKAEPAMMPAATVEAAPPRHRRKVARRKLASKVQHDKLFRDYVRWREAAPKQP